MKILSITSFALFAALLAGGANAADKVCYESELVPAHYECSGSDSKSADFTEGCTMVPDYVKQTPVECPKEAIWVAATAFQSATTVCSARNMRVSNIDGAICQSAEQSVGTEAPGLSGNRYVVSALECNRNNRCDTYSSRMLGYNYSGTIYACWKSGQRKDYDPTDVVRRYACIER